MILYKLLYKFPVFYLFNKGMTDHVSVIPYITMKYKYARDLKNVGMEIAIYIERWALVAGGRYEKQYKFS